MLLIINYILCIHLTSLSFNRADICVLIHQCDYDFPEVLVSSLCFFSPYSGYRHVEYCYYSYR